MLQRPELHNRKGQSMASHAFLHKQNRARRGQPDRKPDRRKSWNKNGVMGRMQAQSKIRFTPERDHALTRSRTRCIEERVFIVALRTGVCRPNVSASPGYSNLRRLIQGWVKSCRKRLGTQFTLQRVTSFIPIQCEELCLACCEVAFAAGWFPQSPLLPLRSHVTEHSCTLPRQVASCIFASISSAPKLFALLHSWGPG